MAPTLTEYLRGKKPQEFRPVPQYFPTGDFLTYFLKDVPYVAEREDDVLTVYLALDTKELVGIKVKGVRHILKTAGDYFGKDYDEHGVKLGIFLYPSVAPDRPDRKQPRYEELRQLADVMVDRKEFCSSE